MLERYMEQSLKELESNYSLNAMQKFMKSDKMAIDKAINKLKPNKAYWVYWISVKTTKLL